MRLCVPLVGGQVEAPGSHGCAPSRANPGALTGCISLRFAVLARDAAQTWLGAVRALGSVL